MSSPPDATAAAPNAGAGTRILKVGPDEDSEAEELEFELAFLRSLTAAQRFELMFRRSREMVELLRSHGHGSAVSIVKRA